MRTAAVLLNLAAGCGLLATYGLLVAVALRPVRERLDRLAQDPLYAPPNAVASRVPWPF